MTVLSAPVAYPTDVPDAAAPTPPRRPFTGTWVFNLIAVAIVASITAFVVYAPFESPDDAGPGSGGEGPRSAVPSAGATDDDGGSAGGASGRAATGRAGATDDASRVAATSSSSTSSSPPTSVTAAGAQPGGSASPPPVQIVYVTPPTTRSPTTTRAPATTSPTTTIPPTTTTTTTTIRPAPTTTTTTIAATPTPAPTTTAPPPQCRDFGTQPEAQAVFDTDPVRFAHFDGDGDGVACEDLPGRPIPTTTLPPGEVPGVDDVIEPTSRYFGVHTREAPFWMADFDRFAADVGKTPNLDMFFQTLGDPFPAAQVDALWVRGIAPMVTFEPIVECASDPVPLPDYDCTGGQPTLDDVTAGRFDDYFATWAAAAAANGKPIVMRFAHEMNGNWYPWGGLAPGNEPADYVPAWRHVHDLFEQAGATNVVWFWNVNRVDNLKDRSLATYYPGDAYADWVGMSAYYRTADIPPSFEGTFGATLTELRKVAPAKPVILGETAAGTSNTNRLTWTADFWAGLLEHPEIWGFVWFNDRKSNTDWRVQYSAEMTAAFAAGVADPRYGSGAAASG
jgi:hypothetical protein